VSDTPTIPAASTPIPASSPPARSALRVWLLAIRPATLPAAAAGVVVGLGAALAVGAPFRLDTALACLAVALFLQVLANLANDLSDFRRGADTPDRAGPTRVAASGLVSERRLEVAIGFVIGLAGLAGLWLVIVGGPVILALGALAIVAALAYTGGPFPYGYRALGEVFVFVFFGVVAVVGTAYLQALRLEPLFFAAAIPPGALITAILVVNNLRDIPTDTAAGKRTLAVVLGRRKTGIEYQLLLAAAYATPALMVLRLASDSAQPRDLAVALPLLTVPLAAPLVRTVRAFGDPRELNAVLKGTARLAFAFSLLFAIGLAVGGSPT
jgi:1,4-dihydroxy-2-naphthoate octaprenyltransferase